MSLSEARSLIMRYKSFLCLTVAALIGPALISYYYGSVESKPAVNGDGKDKHKKKKEGNHESAPALNSGKVFQGGVFEASDVISVPGTDGVLFVDDNRPDEVFWMRLDQEAIKLGRLSLSSLASVSRIRKGSPLMVPGSMSSARNPKPKWRRRTLSCALHLIRRPRA